MTATPRAALLLLALVGCSRPKPPVAAVPPPEVLVAPPEVRTVADFEDFTGRTRASRSADLKTQVTAELKEIGFEDGAEVAAGQLLFALDTTIFQADVDRYTAKLRQAESALLQAKASLKQADAVATEAAKEDKLNKSATSGVSRLDVVKSEGALRVAEAALKVAETGVTAAESAITVAQKELAVAQNYVEYTRIKAPFAGKIGRRQVDPGNRVKQDETILARLVQLDPLDVEFDVDDRTLLRLTGGRSGEAAAVGGWRNVDRRVREGERVIVAGLQRVRAGGEVSPKPAK